MRLDSRITRGIRVLALCSRCLGGDGGGVYTRLDGRIVGVLRGQFDVILLLSLGSLLESWAIVGRDWELFCPRLAIVRPPKR